MYREIKMSTSEDEPQHKECQATVFTLLAQSSALEIEQNYFAVFLTCKVDVKNQARMQLQKLQLVIAVIITQHS